MKLIFTPIAQEHWRGLHILHEISLFPKVTTLSHLTIVKQKYLANISVPRSYRELEGVITPLRSVRS